MSITAKMVLQRRRRQKQQFLLMLLTVITVNGVMSSTPALEQCGNTTSYCPSTRPCCPSQYSPTGYGCLGSNNNHNWLLSSSSSEEQNDDVMCCKPGPPLPPSTNMPNCLILGDSVSIGYTPMVTRILHKHALCQVQHGPWDVVDGGAESTAYGLACLDNFVKTQHQMHVPWHVIVFNFGLHNLQDTTTSTQQVYRQELFNITTRLLLRQSNHHHHPDEDERHHRRRPPKLIYATTTPYMPLANQGIHVVDELNRIAIQVMQSVQEEYGTDTIQILDLNKLVHDHCGQVYQSCDWCRKDPCSFHYNTAGEMAQAQWVATAIKEALTKTTTTTVINRTRQ